MSSPAGLLLSLAGMDDRETINSIALAAPVTTNNQYDWVRQISWVMSIPPNTHPQLTQVHDELSTKIGSFTLPIDAETTYRGHVDVQNDGVLTSDGRQVGRISKEFMPLLERLRSRLACELEGTNKEVRLRVTLL